MGEAPDIREQEDCPSAEWCQRACDQHVNDFPAWCPYNGRCDHPFCLEHLDQCTSALMASSRPIPPALGNPESGGQ